MSRARSILLFVAVAWGFAGCGLYGGTEAGNPTLNETASNNQPVPGQYAQYLLDTICTKYTECYPASTSASCAAGLLAQTNLPESFGLSAGFGTAQQMVDAERAGTIHPDYTHVVNCSSEIRLLSCAAPSVTSASPTGATTSTSSYSRVINMIPTSGTSCSGVF